MAKEVSTLNVEGMSCQHCVNSVRRAVGDLKGVDSVEIDLKNQKVTVGYDAQSISLQTIKEAISDQGYEVK